MHARRLVALVAAVLACGCQAAPFGWAPRLPGQSRSLGVRTAYEVTGAASTRAEFLTLAAQQGLSLDTDTLSAIADATTLQPTGRWAGDLASLQAHWQRYGQLISPGFADPDSYADAAVRFGKRRDAAVGYYFDAEAYRTAGTVVVPRWDANGQLLRLRADGSIESYVPRSAPLPSSYLRIPADLTPALP
jgi:hypothetical protein